MQREKQRDFLAKACQIVPEISVAALDREGLRFALHHEVQAGVIVQQLICSQSQSVPVSPSVQY